MRQTARDTMDCTTFPRINALDAVNAVLLNGTACNDTCGIVCPVGYQPNGGICSGICGDGKVVDGEECDRGGWCIGGTNDFALCLVGGPPICTGGVCQPRTGAGCDNTCQCETTTVCGDGNRCGSEQCDVGMHCNGGDNFNANCTDAQTLCASGGGNCVAGDWVKLCNDVGNIARDCSQDASVCSPSSACTIYGGYCSSTCTVRQPSAFPY